MLGLVKSKSLDLRVEAGRGRVLTQKSKSNALLLLLLFTAGFDPRWLALKLMSGRKMRNDSQSKNNK